MAKTISMQKIRQAALRLDSQGKDSSSIIILCPF